MRKQTKLVAVLSAAALLAIGASMTSFAASGWAQEDGTWVYLDSSGDRVYDTWKKSGSSYFYLNEDGEMATNAIIEDGDYKYYVDASGARVTNQWISMENEDGETIGDNDDISTIWYYFGSNGRANKATNDTNGIKTVNGKKYLFDGDGYMLSGWQEYNDKLYYLGDENEGWAYTGWQYLEVPENWTMADGSNYDDEEWFYFDTSNGKAAKNTRKYINGKYYVFDENGVMLNKWAQATPADSDKLNNSATPFEARYKEDGSQATGWIYAYADNEEDGDQYWFYLDSKGVPFNQNGADGDENSVAIKKDDANWKDPIYGVAAKVIKSKTYLFDNEGKMQTGVFILNGVVRTGSSTNLSGIYYFNKDSGSGQGAMATGKVTVSYDGTNYNYHFQKDGSAYAMYIVDSSLYDGRGERVDADDGNSYTVYGPESEEAVIKVKDGTKLYDITGSHKVTVKTAQGSSTVEGPAMLIVSSGGKVKKSGTVKIDGIKYTLSGYVVTQAEYVD